MHIITGLAVAALMGKGKMKRGGHGIPIVRTGPVRLAHAIPGRVRFRIPEFSERECDAASLAERLSGVEGVHDVSVRPTSGSVLVHYDEGRIGPSLLFAAVVRLIGADRELDCTPVSLVQKELQQACGSLNRTVYDRTGGILDLKTTLLILFVAVGVRKMAQSPGAMLPAGLSMVWWAANGLLRGPVD